MNSVLFLLNATAIAVLVAFHFLPQDNVTDGPCVTHHSQGLSAQLAVLNTQALPGTMTQAATGEAPQPPAELVSERWVF
ncbi:MULTISPECIES: hypothetical protein [Pseudomonas]|uniref:DUF2946 domain-containing protein n=1 Tax=Pseudomonas piscis TaxID=2614538 RepID=A0ABY9NCR2_9PSED|nr:MULTISPECIES: hypothetical protein [Pseudomonas]POA51082.1 hypothetical protein C1889_28905 [Pseudomonas sp. FW507-12TSA]WMN16256.1 hypothetical protein QL104_23315 [Pseudomonas piscis]